MANIINDCEFVSARRLDRTFGRDCTKHYILSIGVKNPETGNTHYAELPLVYTCGLEWAFYDKASNTSKLRKVVAKDTADAIAHARGIFPAWSEFADALPESSSYTELFAWFNEHHDGSVKVSASFRDRDYTAADGTIKTAHEATLFEQLNRDAMPEDFDDAFGKSLKAAGIKFGGGKATTATATVASAKKPIAPAPKAPSAPKKPEEPSRVWTSEDAWSAYEHGDYIKRDPQGEKFYASCAEIIGKPVDTYKAWTSEEWSKCVAKFEALPF